MTEEATPRDPAADLARLRARRSELKAEIDGCTCWGAAVAAMEEELRGVERSIRALEAPNQGRGPSLADFNPHREIAAHIRRWLDWDEKARARQGLPTDASTTLMHLPFWPTHGQLQAWIAALEAPTTPPQPPLGEADVRRIVREAEAKRMEKLGCASIAVAYRSGVLDRNMEDGPAWGAAFAVAEHFRSAVLPPASTGGGGGVAFRRMEDAPRGVPIIARHKPNATMPHGWVGTIKLHDGEEDPRFGRPDTILHYNGETLIGRFYGCWEGWLPLSAAPPPAAETDGWMGLLREVRDKGLIYWEPNTDRGAVNKALMLAKIDALLATSPEGR